MATASTRVQPAVRVSSTAVDRAGVELAPVSATTPAARAAGSSAVKPATWSRASARSMKCSPAAMVALARW